MSKAREHKRLLKAIRKQLKNDYKKNHPQEPFGLSFQIIETNNPQKKNNDVDIKQDDNDLTCYINVV